jgi:hypothetical protein
MFCPKCGSEYRQGFYTCNDCQVALVLELPQTEGIPEYVEYEEILETYSPADIAFIKSILDSENIIYFIKGDSIGCIQPLADRFKLMVSKDQAAEVKELLADMTVSFIGSGRDHDPQEEPES